MAKRGLTMLQAKRAIESLVEDGHVVVSLPMVEDRQTLRNELAAAGISAALVEEDYASTHLMHNE